MSIKSHLINPSKISIKLITAEETIAIRQPVLRKGRPIEECFFIGDELQSTFHLGLFYNKKLIGTATFLKSINDNFKEKTQYQLRGMAILTEFQGKYLGNNLLLEAEKLLTQKGITLIWCNARDTAVSFYKKHNYKIIGNAFQISKIGTHYVMYKIL